MPVIGGFMPEQITVRPGAVQGFIACTAPLPNREGYGMAGEFGPYGRDNIRHAFIGKIGVFPALEDKGFKAQTVPDPAAVKDLSFTEPVSLRSLIAPPDPAVEAVIFAVIGKFDKPAKVYIQAVVFFPHLPGGGKEFLHLRRVFGFDIVEQDLIGPIAGINVHRFSYPYNRVVREVGCCTKLRFVLDSPEQQPLINGPVSIHLKRRSLP
jgi:hypothetical protein